jgi:hypothetical protein
LIKADDVFVDRTKLCKFELDVNLVFEAALAVGGTLHYLKELVEGGCD